MSYASPHPDTALLNTTPPSHSGVADDAAKVNIVAPDFKDHPHTYTSEAGEILHHQDDVNDSDPPAHANDGSKGGKPSKRIQEVEAEGLYLWETAKHYFIRPGVACGLIGLVNVGLVASVGRIFYLRPHLRRDATALSSAVFAAMAVISVEGFAAEKYQQTQRGHEGQRKAKKEGTLIFRHLHEQIMRPGVLGGMVGLVNAALLGSLGYMSYKNWNKTWDRRVVSAISVGILVLWGGEGFVAEKYARSATRKQ
ncbi:hypothetical protein BDZ97DRAFT_1780930 [Flammula alnicola]|nr:hypothetical protein BDZ97DRAFT_1780930 [Flammula alnicola]